MRFDDSDIAAVYRAIFERRDMRHFTPAPVDPAMLARLLRAAHHAPSVGFMQPWRFIRITDPALRTAIHALVEAERRATADALGERQDEFMRLKVEGVRECGELLVVALADGRERHVFGRRTLPEMDLASAACAIQNMMLSVTADGYGSKWTTGGFTRADATWTLLGLDRTREDIVGGVWIGVPAAVPEIVRPPWRDHAVWVD